MQKIFYIVIILFILICSYCLRTIFAPFILAIVFAYVTHPISNILKKRISSNTLISFIIIFTSIITISLFFLILLPNIYDELNHLTIKFGKYKHVITEHDIMNRFHNLDPKITSKIQQILSNTTDSIFKHITNIIYNVWNTGIKFFNFLSIMFLSPIICFYMIRDYDIIIKSISYSLSQFIKEDKIILLKNKIYHIDNILKSYIKGQINVCFIFILYYSLSLKLVNLESAITLGIISGILIIIPYIGFIISLTMAISICIIQYSNFSKLIMIVAIYVIGQIIESNFITPKFIGEKIGLHPVWIIFSILAFSHIFGFVGAIIAIPLAAILQFTIKEIFAYLIYSNNLNSKLLDK